MKAIIRCCGRAIAGFFERVDFESIFPLQIFTVLLFLVHFGVVFVNGRQSPTVARQEVSLSFWTWNALTVFVIVSWCFSQCLLIPKVIDLAIHRQSFISYLLVNELYSVLSFTCIGVTGFLVALSIRG